MKVLKKIKKVLLVTLGIVYFTFALFLTILLLNFNDYRVTVFGETSLVILKVNLSCFIWKNPHKDMVCLGGLEPPSTA